jgi:hypothetical protein
LKANPSPSAVQTQKRVFVTLLFALALSVACSGGGSKQANTAGPGCPTAPRAADIAASLPALFPTPRGVMYSGNQSNGATKQVQAYSGSDLTTTFNLYRRVLGVDPFHITGQQLGDHNAEIDFAGSGATGTVRMAATCRTAGTVAISYTTAS